MVDQCRGSGYDVGSIHLVKGRNWVPGNKSITSLRRRLTTDVTCMNVPKRNKVERMKYGQRKFWELRSSPTHQFYTYYFIYLFDNSYSYPRDTEC